MVRRLQPTQEAVVATLSSNALSVRTDGVRIAGVTQDGIVQSWDAAEALLEHTYKSCLTCNPADHPLLMAEPSHNTAAAREKMTELAGRSSRKLGRLRSHTGRGDA